LRSPSAGDGNGARALLGLNEEPAVKVCGGGGPVVVGCEHPSGRLRAPAGLDRQIRFDSNKLAAKIGVSPVMRQPRARAGDRQSRRIFKALR
jgi:hypothetical protein